MKKYLKLINKNYFFILLFQVNYALSQVLSNESALFDIGVLNFSLPASTLWKSQAITEKKVKEILAHEDIKLDPTFAIEGPRGIVIFGTWKELPSEMVFSASELAKNVPNFPENWGIKEDAIFSIPKTLANGLEYSELRIVGNGDGRVFGLGKQYKTLAIWVDVPITYKDTRGFHSGLASLFYRGPDINSKGTPDTMFLTVLNSLKIKDGYSLVSTDVYKKASLAKESLAQGEPTSNTQKIVPPEKNSTITANMSGLIEIDGSTYCVNKGIYTHLPCTISLQAPKVNYAFPIELINAINKAAR